MPALLATITVGLIYFNSETANKIIIYFGLSTTALISLSFLFIVLLTPVLMSEPIFENFAHKIQTKLRKSYQYMFYLTLSLILAGFISHSAFAHGAAALTLIFGLTLLYFYYCTNLILKDSGSLNV
jgi:hypothetical protein